MDNDVNKKLEELAYKQRVSVNVLASQAIRRYVEWDSIAKNFSLQVASTRLLERLMEDVTVDKAGELGRWWADNIAKEISSYWFQNESFRTFNKTLEMLNSYGRSFEVERTHGTDREMLILNHGLGEKWSLFYQEALKTWLERMDSNEVKSFKVDHTENQVFTEIRTPQAGLGPATDGRLGLVGPSFRGS